MLLFFLLSDTIHVVPAPPAQELFPGWLVGVVSTLASITAGVLVKRWFDQRDKANDAEKAAEKAQKEKVDKHDLKLEENTTQHQNFHNIIENLGNEVEELKRLTNENKDRSTRSELKVDAIKEHLARVEVLLTNIMLKHDK